MNISNLGIKQTPNFAARVTIEAPESLLRKEDREKLINKAQKIGTNNDTIEIKLGSLKPNKVTSRVVGYDVEKKIMLKVNDKFVIEETESTLPYLFEGEVIEQSDPKKYIARVLDRISEYFK